MKLLHKLKVTSDLIAGLAWSPSGELLAVVARGGAVSVWEALTGVRLYEFELGTDHAYNIAWSPNGQRFAVSCEDPSVRIFRARDGHQLASLKVPTRDGNRRYASWQVGIAWHPHFNILATGGEDAVRLWNTETGEILNTFVEQRLVSNLSWSSNGLYLASTSFDSTTCIWDTRTRSLMTRLAFGGHPALAWSPDSRLLALTDNATIVVYDLNSSKIAHMLEAHSSPVRALSFSFDGKFLASRAGKQEWEQDKQLCIWRTDEWVISKLMQSPPSPYFSTGLSFHPSAPILAAAMTWDRDVSIWSYDANLLNKEKAATNVVYYKNAKVALVGNSGVGKSGLALVLNEKPFAPTESTHGRAVYPLSRQQSLVDGYRSELREVLLWDLAGQPGYRIIHQLHLDDVDVGVIVFDSKDESDPLAGIKHWNRALDHSQQVGGEMDSSMAKILVAARTDRGPVGVGSERIEVLCRELGISGYVETSSKTNAGIEELRAAIYDAIPWGELPTVTSTQQLRRLRERLAEEVENGRVLITIEDLQKALDSRPGSKIGSGLLKTYLSRLQRLGVLKSFSFGNLLLLKPELLDSYAAAIVFSAKQEPDGMGSILTKEIRAGNLQVPSEDRILTASQEELLLVATTEDFIRHEVALREPSEAGDLLVFPSQLTRENPELPDPEGKSMKFTFTGPIANIYAALIVRLAHSEIFSIEEMWRNAAIFKVRSDGSCGVFLTERGEGQGSLTIFHRDHISRGLRNQFEYYVESHLLRRASVGSIAKERFYYCGAVDCQTPVIQTAVNRRRARGFDKIECNVCNSVIFIGDTDGEVTAEAPVAKNLLIDSAADATQAREAFLVSAAGEILSSKFLTWAGSERATVAIVFTDILGSTRIASQEGDEAMWDIRTRHFGGARKIIAEFGGHEIKTLGDSFMVAFRTALQAFSFAKQLFTNPGADILVRVGIHVGPIRIEDGDAFGNVVNYAARVVGSTSEAVIRLSNRAYEDLNLEKAAIFSSVRWKEINVESLKGLSGAHKIWESNPRE